MSVTSENNKRIAKNTLFLYLRMLLIMGVTLYTSRVVLRVLGVEDFGIYSAVGGFVSMFAVISGSLTAAISRFITYEMGVGNTEKIARIFSVSVVIQLLISGIIVLFSGNLRAMVLKYADEYTYGSTTCGKLGISVFNTHVCYQFDKHSV